jgi:hypothetical protein
LAPAGTAVVVVAGRALLCVPATDDDGAAVVGTPVVAGAPGVVVADRAVEDAVPIEAAADAASQ